MDLFQNFIVLLNQHINKLNAIHGHSSAPYWTLLFAAPQPIPYLHNLPLYYQIQHVYYNRIHIKVTQTISFL